MKRIEENVDSIARYEMARNVMARYDMARNVMARYSTCGCLTVWESGRKKILMIVMALLAAFLATPLAHGKEYSYVVGPFSQLRILDNVDVVYRCTDDSVGRVVYHSSPDFANAFILTNNGKQLKIQVATPVVDRKDLPTVYVYSSGLVKAENYSDRNLHVESLCPCAQFGAYLIGNGSIEVDNLRCNTVKAAVTAGNGTVKLGGNAQEAVYRMTGAGSIKADGLEAGKVKCKILGGGSVTCWPVGKLTVGGLGSTKVFYRGQPEIKHVGGGKVLPLETAQATF